MTMLLPARPVRELPAGSPSVDDESVVDGGVVVEDLSLAGLVGAGKAKLSSVSLVARKGLRGLLTRRELAQVKPRTAGIVALVPAHNEEADIARTVDALLSQTRRIDRIVVILDNCTDGTEKILSRYKGITVMKTHGNIDKKVGALTQGWQRYSHLFDFVLGVDADTVLAPDAVEQLETEMLRVPSAAGVMARYTFDVNLGTTFFARQLIRAQRMDFASWLTDIMARNRSTYVLGGQATLFRVKHLQEVIDTHERNSPWDPDAQVEDMELTWRLHEAGRKTLVSATARAYAGPMVTVKGLMGQRRKWDEGMAALLWQNKMPDKNTMIPWRQQFNMFSNGIVRILFVVLLMLSLSVHQFVWSPIWFLPILVGIALNFKVAGRAPARPPADLLYAILVIPAEMWMISRMWSTLVSWLNIWFGARRDGWAAQAAAESGKGTANTKLISKLLGTALALATIVAIGMWAWIDIATPALQRTVLTTGWAIASVMTIILPGFALIKLFKPTRGYKP